MYRGDWSTGHTREIKEMEVRFDKKFLVDTLTANKEKHKAEYEEGVEEYWLTCQQKVAEISKQIEERTYKERYIHLPSKLTSHVKDYERVLSMLEATVDSEISLNQKEYSQYVLDDWEWKEDFTNVKSSYSSLSNR